MLACIVLDVVLLHGAPETTTPLTIARQGSFFVGGREVHSETLSTGDANTGPNGTITVDQVYVRFQIPLRVDGVTMTLIHGCCLTGKTWETTPDGRMGWDEYFLRKGHAVYVVDQAARGRSASDPTVINSVKVGHAPREQLPTVRSAPHEEAWVNFRIGPEFPKAYPGTQFPVEAAGEFWKQMVPDWAGSLPTPNPTVAGLSELAVRLGRTVLVSHSQSGIYPFQTAALNAQGIAGIVAIEPAACPDAAGDLSPFTQLPILVLWGDNIARSMRWAPRLKQCQAFVDAAKKRGGHVESVELPTVGMHGNSHMLMQDKNNLEIADWLLAWVARNLDSNTAIR
jgi:pimeloyl-ACP methyl ester carboxylesterase